MEKQNTYPSKLELMIAEKFSFAHRYKELGLIRIASFPYPKEKRHETNAKVVHLSDYRKSQVIFDILCFESSCLNSENEPLSFIIHRPQEDSAEYYDISNNKCSAIAYTIIVLDRNLNDFKNSEVLSPPNYENLIDVIKIYKDSTIDSRDFDNNETDYFNDVASSLACSKIVCSPPRWVLEI